MNERDGTGRNVKDREGTLRNVKEREGKQGRNLNEASKEGRKEGMKDRPVYFPRRMCPDGKKEGK